MQYRIAAIHPVAESFPHSPAEPYHRKKDAGNKQSQKIGLMGEVPDGFEREWQDQQGQKDQQNDLSEYGSHR